MLGVGDTIVTMLTDYNGFWQYDNRESFVEDSDERAWPSGSGADEK